MDEYEAAGRVGEDLARICGHGTHNLYGIPQNYDLTFFSSEAERVS